MNQTNHTTPETEFIDAIHQEKALWDPNHQHYKDIEIKSKIWNTLAEKCNSTAMEVRRRWTGLREKYRREKIYNSKLRRNGSAAETQRWSSFDKMSFLDQVYVPRGSYRIYRELTDTSGLNNNQSHSGDYFPMIKTAKQEENSMDEDYNIGDYLETNVDCSNSESMDAGNIDMYGSSSSPAPETVFNEQHPFYGRLSKKQIQTLQSQQVWINATAKSSAHLLDGESTSPPLSNRSGANRKSLSYLEDRLEANANRYSSFGMYIADTLNRLDDKHAHELHISILQEIIKVQTKVASTH